MQSRCFRSSAGLQRCRRQAQCRPRTLAAYASLHPLPQLAQPDLQLQVESQPQHKVVVFGITHTENHAAIAEYVLQTRPAAVVVETAVTPEHGSLPGNVIACGDPVAESSAAFYMRMYCQLASTLQEEAKSHNGNFLETDLWKKVSTGAFRGEQLTYIAALAANVPLVFGDRPKDVTYRRLYLLPSIPQLDEGFGIQAVNNYLHILGQPPTASQVDAPHVTQLITMQEREAVMCAVADEWARGAAPSQHVLPAAQDLSTSGNGGQSQASSRSNADRGRTIVMLVGQAHVPGIKALWTSGEWQRIVGSQGIANSQLMKAPPLEMVPDQEVGLRRGLLHALLRMSAPAEVLLDVEQTLGPVPPEQQLAFQSVSEIYGSTRTMLACLPRDLLDKVCVGAPQEGGSRVDLFSLLGPLRQHRPSAGGPGYSDEMVTYIRALNFDLD